MNSHYPQDLPLLLLFLLLLSFTISLSFFVSLSPSFEGYVCLLPNWMFKNHILSCFHFHYFVSHLWHEVHGNVGETKSESYTISYLVYSMTCEINFYETQSNKTGWHIRLQSQNSWNSIWFDTRNPSIHIIYVKAETIKIDCYPNNLY